MSRIVGMLAGMPGWGPPAGKIPWIVELGWSPGFRSLEGLAVGRVGWQKKAASVPAEEGNAARLFWHFWKHAQEIHGRPAALQAQAWERWLLRAMAQVACLLQLQHG